MSAPEHAADASLLGLIWLASPALPVGGFSYSEGLEAAVECGRVATESDAAAWLLDQLHLAQARGDLPALAAAHAAWLAGNAERARTVNTWLLATRESSELRLQTEQMGKSLADWLRNLHGDHPGRRAAIDALATLSPSYPVAFALAAAFTAAAPREVLLAYAFGWAENMVQAAIKSVPLGQNSGQRILAALAAEIPLVVDSARSLSDDEWQAFSPMLAIHSARHEMQYSRLFRS